VGVRKKMMTVPQNILATELSDICRRFYRCVGSDAIAVTALSVLT
jgi:hypothetical protein